LAVDPWVRWTDRQRRLLEAIGGVPWPIGASTTTEDTITEGPGAPAGAAASKAAGADGPRAVEPRASAGPPSHRAPAQRSTAPPAGVAAAEPSRPGRPPGIDTLGWAPLAAAAAECRACSLCAGRTQAVFGTGRQDAHWLVVGEAPGEQEDQQGEPFVGKSGQLLDAMLAAIGVSRAPQGDDPARAAYIANTVKCRPPGNRNPQPEELAQCEPFLIRQIELLRPRLILAMGRFAVQSLLRSDEAIGRLRGRVHRYQGAPLVVTYHPAYLLRNPLDKARAWEDLCLAREVFDRPE
jgi:uracil-DNA glycosylase